MLYLEAASHKELAAAQRRVDQVTSLLVHFEEDGDGGAGGGEDGGVEGLALGMIGNLACLGKVESPN